MPGLSKLFGRDTSKKPNSVERATGNVEEAADKVKPRRATPRRHKSMDGTKSGQLLPRATGDGEPPSTKVQPRRATPRRHKSVDGAENGQALPRRGKRRTLQKTNSSSKMDGSGRSGHSGLADRDLDNIYDFVKHMKQTNMGGSMLGEFVVRRTEDVESVNEPKAGPIPLQIQIQ